MILLRTDSTFNSNNSTGNNNRGRERGSASLIKAVVGGVTTFEVHSDGQMDIKVRH